MDFDLIASRVGEAADAAASTSGSARAVGYGAHAADDEASASCVDFSVERFGSAGILLSSAVTNLGVRAGPRRFTKTIEVNLWASILWTQLTWRAWMAEQGRTDSCASLTPIGVVARWDRDGILQKRDTRIVHDAAPRPGQRLRRRARYDTYERPVTQRA